MSLFRILTYRTFEPTEISGLQVWLDMTNVSETIGSTIATWTDQSGNAHDFIQPVASYQPSITEIGTSGQKQVSFGGASVLYCPTGLDILKNTAGGTIYAVIRPSSGSICIVSDGLRSTRARLQIGNTSTPNRYTATAKRIDADSGESVMNGVEEYVIPRTYNIQGAIADYLNLDYYSYINSRLDDSITSASTGGNTSNTDSAAVMMGVDCETPSASLYPNIGVYPSTATFANFDIVELLIFNKALSALEKFNIERYLSIKHDITLSTLTPSTTLLPDTDLFIPW